MTNSFDIAISFSLLGVLAVYGWFAIRQSKTRSERFLHLTMLISAILYATHTLYEPSRETWQWYFLGSGVGHYPFLVWWVLHRVAKKSHPGRYIIAANIGILNTSLLIAQILNVSIQGRTVDFFVLIRTISTIVYGVMVAKIILEAMRQHSALHKVKKSVPLQKFVIGSFILLPIVDVLLRQYLSDGDQVGKLTQKLAICFGTFWYLHMTMSYSTSRMSQIIGIHNKRERRIIAKISKIFEEDQVFLDPALNMKLIAKKVGVPEYTVRKVVSDTFDVANINELINRYRIAESMRLLQSTDHGHLTIASIAWESGFSTLSSFNLAFKKFNGTTPSEFRKNSGQPAAA